MILQIQGRNLELTDRETETLRHIADGKANKQIAVAMDLSVKTVEKHRQNVMNKLGIHDAVRLTHFALSRGIVQNAFAGELTQ